MKVLVVTNMYPEPDRPTDGIFVKEQVDALRAAGIPADLMVLPVHRSRLHYIAGVFRVALRTLTGRYDIVHAHYGFTGAVCICRFGAKLVTTFHGSDINIPWQRRISRIAFRFSDEAVFVSEKIFRKMGGRKGHVIPCGVDFETFRPRNREEARKRYGFEESMKYVLFPGARSNGVKNYPLFSETVASVTAHAVSPVFLENILRDEVPLLLSACDAMLLTSYSEGSPMVVKEALACNLPVVSTDVGDVAERIGSLPGCRVCPPSADLLAEALSESLSGGSYSLREAAADISSEAVVRKLGALYHQAGSR